MSDEGGKQQICAMKREDLPSLLSLLAYDGYRTIGPTIRDGAIVHTDLDRPEDLPVGWREDQSPGFYRLARREDDRYFGFVVGPQSWKQFLFPPRERIVETKRNDGGVDWIEPVGSETPLALVGVRACDMHAIQVQDRVFLGGLYVDPGYKRRRESCLIIGVNCLEAGGLCFCGSMGTGPRILSGFDICLTELNGAFVLEASGSRGRGILDRLPTRSAASAEVAAVDKGIEECRAAMGRVMAPEGLPELLLGNMEHPRWDDVGERCLSCGNCTLVCPTCFCFSIEDSSDLKGYSASRQRRWDSCFTKAHSRVHGAFYRPTTRERYRQWLGHKLGFWFMQFGTSGCVGCGRCIAWCPVGIDLTEEINAIRQGKEAVGPARRGAKSVTVSHKIGKPAPALGEPHSPLPIPAQRPPGVTSEDNPLLPTRAAVLATRKETHDVTTLTLGVSREYQHKPGQFNMLSLPGIGEVPISVSGQNGNEIEHTIRAVGATTKALCALQEGDSVGVRGPFGSSWPYKEVDGRAVTVIAGGIGLAPLRSTLRFMDRRAGKYQWARLVYGARSPEDLLFGDELHRWRMESDLWISVTVDRGSPTWTGNIGAVTALLHRKELPEDGIYLMCGPEVMMRVVIRLLERAGVLRENIYVSMERNMKCAAGLCGRCQLGPYFVCKDGPVFRFDQISFLFGRKGF